MEHIWVLMKKKIRTVFLAIGRKLMEKLRNVKLKHDEKFNLSLYVS